MRLDETLGQSRHVACASSCMSMRTSLEEGIKLQRFADIFPEQFLTEGGRHREAVVAADQPMVIRCFRDDLSSSSTMFLVCRLQSNARRYRPGIGSSDAPEQWHPGRTAQAVCMLDQQIAGTLCTMPCVSAIPFSGIHCLSPAFMLSPKKKSERRRGSRPPTQIPVPIATMMGACLGSSSMRPFLAAVEQRR